MLSQSRIIIIILLIININTASLSVSSSKILTRKQLLFLPCCHSFLSCNGSNVLVGFGVFYESSSTKLGSVGVAIHRCTHPFLCHHQLHILEGLKRGKLLDVILFINKKMIDRISNFERSASPSQNSWKVGSRWKVGKDKRGISFPHRGVFS